MFVVFGAGAVGGVVGGRLFEHGHDVALIARGAHHDAIRDHGLRVEDPERTVTLPVPVVDHPRRLRLADGDVVLLAMKTQDTAAAVADLAAVAPPGVQVVCLQNGVENERLALRRFAGVHAAVVMCPTAHLAPGVVQAFSAPTNGLFDVGRYPEGADDHTAAIVAALASSAFDALVRHDVMRWKHAKLLGNLGNAVEAACGWADGAAELAELARAEGEACLRAAGIPVASREEDKDRRAGRLEVRPIGGAARPGGSSWQSLQRRRGAIESDYLNGEIVLLGRLHGIETPINALLQTVANELAAAGAPPGSMAPAELRRRLRRPGPPPAPLGRRAAP